MVRGLYGYWKFLYTMQFFKTVVSKVMICVFYLNQGPTKEFLDIGLQLK